jgi:predicted phage tail protein
MNTRVALTLFLILMSAALLRAAVPSPPRNLAAEVSGTTVTLTWEAPVLPGGTLFGYGVMVSLSPGGPIVSAIAHNDTTLVVPNVPAGVYYVHVFAANAEGNSAPSNEVVVTVQGPPPCLAPPDAPSNLSGSVLGDVVTLTWTAPVAGCAAAGYGVLAGSAPGLSDLAVINVGSATSFSASAPAGTYSIRVVAFNEFGIGAPSNEVTVVSAGPCSVAPDPPANLTAATLGDVVTLKWAAPAAGCLATGYVVQAGSGAGLSDLAILEAGAEPSLTVAAPPGTYYVRVIARNASGDSAAASNEVVVSVTTTVADVAGTWSGTSTYFNAPFTFELTQSGNIVGGTYQDQHDVGSVSGTVDGTSVVLNVWFGDTGTRFTGRIEAPNRIHGIIHGGPIGGPYPFEMTR